MKTKKMRIFATMLLVVMCLGMLAGCGHTHKWTDATCTQPKTCADCGEKEGEALEHQLSEATYQSPAQCSVCGTTVGDALVADFITYGIETDISAVGDSADYLTTSGSASYGDVVGKTTLTSYEILPSFRVMEEREGYECRVAVFETEFGSDVLANGVHAMFYVTDYYNIKLFTENIDHSNELYSVANLNFNGENQSVYVSQSGKYQEQGDKLIFTLTICAQVPVGYDGIVGGLVYNGACEAMGDISTCYAPEKFVLFRMGN